jgi:hypothetical protein
MIRRSPAEYYIKYLLLHPDDYGDGDIERTLREHHLDYPSGDYLARLRSRMRPPKPFYPMNDRHQPSFKYLVIEKVHTLFHPDRRTHAALDILNTPRVKEVVEVMAIVGDPPALTVTRLRKMGLGEYKTADILRYQHFFWNVSLVDATELRALMTKRVDDMALDDPNNPGSVVAYKAMKRAQYNDSRFDAVNSPCSALSAMRLQIRFGYMPDRIDTTRLAGLGAHVCGLAAGEAPLVGGPKAAQNARDYAIAAKNLAELRQMLGAPDESIRKDLYALGVQTASAEDVPHIDSLTEGDYTDGFILTEGENVEK